MAAQCCGRAVASKPRCEEGWRRWIMQTQWAKANISSETKDTPLRSQGGPNSSHYLREVILTEGLFFLSHQQMRGCAESLCAAARDQSLQSACVCRGEAVKHRTAVTTAHNSSGALSWPCYHCHSQGAYSWEARDKFVLICTPNSRSRGRPGLL